MATDFDEQFFGHEWNLVNIFGEVLNHLDCQKQLGNKPAFMLEYPNNCTKGVLNLIASSFRVKSLLDMVRMVSISSRECLGLS